MTRSAQNRLRRGPDGTWRRSGRDRAPPPAPGPHAPRRLRARAPGRRAAGVHPVVAPAAAAVGAVHGARAPIGGHPPGLGAPGGARDVGVRHPAGVYPGPAPAAAPVGGVPGAPAPIGGVPGAGAPAVARGVAPPGINAVPGNIFVQALTIPDLHGLAMRASVMFWENNERGHGHGRGRGNGHGWGRGGHGRHVRCFRCGGRGHMAAQCPN